MKKWMLIILALVLFSSLALVPSAFAFKVAGEEVVSATKQQTTNSQRFAGSELVSKPEIRCVRIPYPVAAPKPEDRIDYEVAKGDYLEKVAGYFNTTINVLWAINPNIKNPNLIRVGQVLKVPAPYAETRQGKLEATNRELEKRTVVAENQIQIAVKRAESAEGNVASLTKDLTAAKTVELEATKRAEEFMKRAQVAEIEAINLKVDLADAQAKADQNWGFMIQADQKATDLAQANVTSSSQASIYQLMLLVIGAYAFFMTALVIWVALQLRNIKAMFGGQDINVDCPHGCGEMLSPKNYNRHIHTRCPKRPGAQQNAQAATAA